LSLASAEAGYRLTLLGSTQSTNDDALRSAEAGDPGHLWVVAEEQLAGRGRHGRLWASPPGNLYASLLLIDPCDPSASPQLGFVAGVALHEAVERFAGIGIPRLALKWPNDLLLDGAKLAGLLVEAHRIEERLAVIVGFGVNVAFAPEGMAFPAASLREAALRADRAALIEALSDAFARTFSDWRRARRSGAADAFEGIRSRWLERAAGIGGPVRLRLPGGERSGTFEGLDRDGRLRLRTAAGLELIDAGDLYFPHSIPRAPVRDVPAG
jgi:BirA family biotin operon repressor/biotin-[acetyl-CoA-carboxylase] ligase